MWLNLADVVPKESEAVVTDSMSGVWGEQIQEDKDENSSCHRCGERRMRRF